MSLDDAKIAAVVESLHRRIEEEAELAEHAAQSEDVRALSTELVSRHSNVLTTEQSLCQRLTLVPHLSAVSQQIDADGIHAIETLRGDRGLTFDRDYLDTQARSFEDSIHLLDRMYTLARAPELQSEITRSRVDLVAGMESLSQLQRTMNVGVTSMQGK